MYDMWVTARNVRGSYLSVQLYSGNVLIVPAQLLYCLGL